MAPHSSTLAWRIPGTGEPGGLPFVGLHRVGHDWSDLAAAAHHQEKVIAYNLWLHAVSFPTQPHIKEANTETGGWGGCLSRIHRCGGAAGVGSRGGQTVIQVLSFYIYINIHTHTYIYTHTHTYIYIYVYIYICIYIHNIQIYIHVCIYL